jgi:hypothetical protein
LVPFVLVAFVLIAFFAVAFFPVTFLLAKIAFQFSLQAALTGFWPFPRL